MKNIKKAILLLERITGNKVILKENKELINEKLTSLLDSLSIINNDVDSLLVLIENDNELNNLKREINSFQLEINKISDKINEVVGIL